jgi:hypothetical protein
VGSTYIVPLVNLGLVGSVVIKARSDASRIGDRGAT